MGQHATGLSEVLMVGLGDVHCFPVDLGLNAVLGAQMVRQRSCGHPQGAFGALLTAAEALRVGGSHSGGSMGIGLV